MSPTMTRSQNSSARSAISASSSMPTTALPAAVRVRDMYPVAGPSSRTRGAPSTSRTTSACTLPDSRSILLKS